MRTFLVSYDLAKPELNQPYIAEAIMSLGASWARPLENVWYLRAEETQTEIEARLSRLLDEHDGLLIQETRGDARMLNTGLRWFRRRRGTLTVLPPDETQSNVVSFPPPRVQPSVVDIEAEAVEIRAAS